jgi:LytS/YehU family sensor histidine kinase
MTIQKTEITFQIFMLVGLAVLYIWLFTKLKKAQKQKDKLAKENAKLLAENTLLEVEQLKFQLQPHTLNNILAHLKLTANKLNQGLASFSETLEYILYKGKNHLVSVDEEINFIQEYLRLNEIFISELDAIKVDYSQVNKHSKYFHSPCIPHLITAYFIENAFKHGNIKEKESLKIILKLSDKEFEMKVVNMMKQKTTTTQGGLGLKNMKRRLDLLNSNKYYIQNSINENQFHSQLTIIF